MLIAKRFQAWLPSVVYKQIQSMTCCKRDHPGLFLTLNFGLSFAIFQRTKIEIEHSWEWRFTFLILFNFVQKCIFIFIFVLSRDEKVPRFSWILFGSNLTNPWGLFPILCQIFVPGIKVHSKSRSAGSNIQPRGQHHYILHAINPLPLKNIENFKTPILLHVQHTAGKM